jgi:mRNA interferase RelE/StbE
MKLGNSKYHIEYLNVVVQDDIPALPSSAKKLIQAAIEQCLMIDPIGFGKPLRYSLKGHRRLRVSHYRIVYRINQEKNTVIIVAIKHRKHVYND